MRLALLLQVFLALCLTSFGYESINQPSKNQSSSLDTMDLMVAETRGPRVHHHHHHHHHSSKAGHHWHHHGHKH
uniref:Uncharacterized protein n=1 Tax=Tetranychus urticae TaxID=32264 RepID=T1K6A4_TETUR